MRSNRSPWPISTGEWVAAVLFGPFAVLTAAVVAANDLNVLALVGLGLLSGYCTVSGRFGLRRGYNLRDRFLLLFGVLLGGGLIVGAALPGIAR